jgi:serine/threonine-protein kinase
MGADSPLPEGSEPTEAGGVADSETVSVHARASAAADDDESGAEPTELAGTAEAETESVHAWGLSADEGDDEYELPTQRFTPRRITAAAVITCLVVIAVAAGVAVYVLRDDASARATHDDAPKPPKSWMAPQAAPTAGSPPSPEQLLNGTHQVVNDWPNTRWHLSPRSVKPEPSTAKTEWWSLATECANGACTATAVPLTGDAGTPVPHAGSIQMKFENGIWQQSRPRRIQIACQYFMPDGTTGTATNWNAYEWTWAPKPDGSFGGNLTITVDTNECGFLGDWVSVPLIITHVGAG